MYTKEVNGKQVPLKPPKKDPYKHRREMTKRLRKLEGKLKKRGIKWYLGIK